MKATEAKFLDLLRKSPQFVIPIYQRTYSWSENECRQLWDDIIRTGRNDEISAHFVGSVVYIEEGLYQISSQSPLLVIDGQQRLTTVSLILEALARQLGDNEPVDGFSAEKLRSYFLLNTLEKGERRFKLLLTQTDKASMLALVQQNELPDDKSLRLEANFDFFTGLIKTLGDDISALCHGLAKLVVVDISLSRTQDNPQLIFESMNSTGRALSQADLIRNFILMGLEAEQQTSLYESHWRPMETKFGQEGYASYFDSFMRHYLTLKTGEIPNIRGVYEAFKLHARTPTIDALGVEALVEDIHIFAGYYCSIALGSEDDEVLAAAFQDLRDLKVDVAHPFLLELYADYRKGVLNVAEFESAIRLVESYVFRRAICAIPTNSLNKTFATLGRAIDKEHYVESIQAQLLNLPSYRRFPRDEEFRGEFTTRDLYHFPRRGYWLRRIENFDRKERVPVDEYTIEHILPQNTDLSTPWQEDLGSDWQQVQEKWLHTLGNLTLTGYNSEYSDRPFLEKRDMEGGFKESPLRLNEGLGGLETWNVDAIAHRANYLSTIATRIWSLPSVRPELLEAQKPIQVAQMSYSIDDHKHLSSVSPMRGLFDDFREAVCGLDPCVSEEFLKLYVAYKAETNFVDVIPQQSKLRLVLNLDFHELHDPKGIARDITNLGRWGNGNTEVAFSSPEEMAYVIGLVRQAFDTQMDFVQS